MEAKGLFGVVQRIVSSRIGVAGVALGAMYCGYSQADTLRRFEHNLLYKNTALAEGFFKDPAGLRVETALNAHGSLEVYLVHSSGSRQAVLQDMLPDTKTVFLALSKRINQEDSAHIAQKIEPDASAERR
ncbi:MAG: hypothetical protein Q7K43_02575 [Candidatus Woesearchaeota archaeon]|nr:hypothetical protein [Candidatus Woesearchaeota archaeon]